jgi:hypothetical protein
MPGLPIRPHARVLILLVALALAGCADMGLDAAPREAKEPGQVTGSEAPDASAAAPSAALVNPPASLIGLDGPTVEHWFGKPGLVRRDYPAEVWQYRNPSCVLDVYLYDDDDRLTVSHAEARAPKIAGDPMRPCLAKLAALNRKATG